MMKRSIILVLLLCLATAALADTQGGKRYVLVVNNWAGGMFPVIGPFANHNTIAYSKNFISVQPNGTHLRYGYRGLLPDPAGTAPQDTTTAVAVFAPTQDSAYVLYTAGGVWYGNQAGAWRWRPSVIPGAPEINWKATLVAEERINPRNTGDTLKLTNASGQVIGVGTRFIRDVAEGDTLYTTDKGDSTSARVVKYIYSDTRLQVAPVADTSENLTTWTFARRYDKSAGAPYLFPSGEFLYTGNIGTAPQVIYNQNDSLFIRELGIVDSFYIDSMYYFSGRITYADTNNGVAPSAYVWDTTTNPMDLYDCGPGDTGRCSLGVLIDDIRTWDTTFLHGYRSSTDYDTFNVFLRAFQVVSRRKSWQANEWRENIAGAPEAYYVRLGNNAAGPGGNAKFFSVLRNDDTSLFLNRWVLQDTALAYTNTGVTTKHWQDSVFLGRGLDFNDTTAVSNYIGTWGYIYTTAGSPQVIVDDEDTEWLKVQGVGAFCYTVDATFPVDTTEFLDGLYFIRLLSDDIEFRGYTDELQNEFVEEVEIEPRENNPTLEDTDSLLDTWKLWAVYEDDRPFGSLRKLTENFDTYQEANDAKRELDCGLDCRVYSVDVWKIRRGKNRTVEYPAAFLLNGTTIPISYAQKNGDTTFFICATSYGLTLTNWDSTKAWEIVRPRLPRWRDITASNRGAGLVAWGDTIAPATISMSPGYDPWKFSVLNDVTVGNPSDPLTAVAVYDNQVLGFKRNSITSATTGEGLSDGLGAVGSEAVAVQDKSIFFGAEDGIYQMDRRDYNGYSIQPISRPIDPIYQDWAGLEWGNNTVPFNVERQYLGNLTLVVNPRDHHLWAWMPTTDSATGLGVVMTYNYETGVWDGYHDIPVGGVAVAIVRDTTRIIFGSVDSAYVYMMDYSYNDAGTGIDGDIMSKNFVLRDDQGRKVYSRLESINVTTRSINGAYDSAKVTINTVDNNYGTQSATYTIAGQSKYAHKVAGSINTEKFYANVNAPQGEIWWWRLQVWGASSFNVFMPVELEIEWVAVEDR